MKKRLFTSLFATLMLVFMVSAVQTFAAENGEIAYLRIVWSSSDGEITASYDPVTDSFTCKKWDDATSTNVDAGTQLPSGVSYDKDSGTVTLDNAAIEEIFYRGTKDLKIYVKGNSSLEMIKVDDGREAVKDPETGNNTGAFVCYHGGDIVVYGDDKNQSTLNFDSIWQITSVGSFERLEPDADDGDVIIKDLTLKGNYIESAISNLTIDSCNVMLTGRQDADGDYSAAYIMTGGLPEEYANPEGLLTVKDSIIELTGLGSYITFLEYEMNGENVYLGNGKPEKSFDFNNNYYKSSYGYYYSEEYQYILITTENIKIPEGSDDPTPVNPQPTPIVAPKVPVAPTEIVDLPTVKISKPKAAKKKITVKWKKVSKKNLKKISGIQIQVATDPAFTNIVKTATAGKKKTSKVIKGLSPKTKYYVRIRAYAAGNHVSVWKSKSAKVK